MGGDRSLYLLVCFDPLRLSPSSSYQTALESIGLCGAVDVFIILSGFVITYLIYSWAAGRHRVSSWRAGSFGFIRSIWCVCSLAGSAVALESFILTHASWREVANLQDWMASAMAGQVAHPVSHFLAHLTLLFGLIPEKLLPGASAIKVLGPAWSITFGMAVLFVGPAAYPDDFISAAPGLLLLGLIGACDFIFRSFLERFYFYHPRFRCSWWASVATTVISMRFAGGSLRNY